jgi:hypothetical protein
MWHTSVLRFIGSTAMKSTEKLRRAHVELS